MTTNVATYLFKRLQQCGVESVHGVPGDYNLELLDYVVPSGLRWVGNANELNAGYAADGYSRVKGMGALITTFGVGELSAVNAIAGAYAERAPVVHVVGYPTRKAQRDRASIHHTFADGEFRRFAHMAAHVVCAQVILDNAGTAPEQIDAVLKACRRHSRPVYIGVPVDLVAEFVARTPLETVLDTSLQVGESQKASALVGKISEAMERAKKPILYIDGETRAFQSERHARAFAEKTQWPTWTSAFAKGVVDEQLSNVHGVYQGSYSDPEEQQAFTEADLVLCIGPHFSNTNSYLGSAIPEAAKTIAIGIDKTTVFGEVFEDVQGARIMSALQEHAPSSNAWTFDKPPRRAVDPAKHLTQRNAWRVLESFLQPNDIVLGETGTAGYGVREMILPTNTQTFLPSTWLSIGYMLPAAQGAALAQREISVKGDMPSTGDRTARTVLVIGDGSFQMTAQELSTVIRLELDVVVVLVNNDGYTIERCIHGRDQEYNDVARWKYLQAPSFMGAPEDTFTARAETVADLQELVRDDRLKNGKGLRMIEIVLDRNDVPEGPLQGLMDKQMSAS